MKKKINRVILLGRKLGAREALRYLINKRVEVPLVVSKKGEPLWEYAKERGIRVYNDDDPVYSMIERRDKSVLDVDLVISYLFWKKIRHPLISAGKIGCINFHPAPLPDYKSRAGYNTAILDMRAWFGVSAHFIDSEKFDSGPIIKVLRFKMDPHKETAYSLEKRTQLKLFELFRDVIDDFLLGKAIKTSKNTGGLYLTSEELEKMKEVDLRRDSLEFINRKVRAFFFPPYNGATITVKNQKFTLINEEVMKLIGEIISKQK
jgi:methionyl-tRNA formyltransferase